jgi:ribosomal protein L29
MAKKTSFKDKNKGELMKLLSEKREELRKLRFEAAGSRPKDSNAPGKVRKDIARIQTELKRA